MNPENIIQHVKDCAKTLSGEFNLSNKGVPRVIMTGKDMKISLVYVARADCWKAFFPYPSNNQQRKYFGDVSEMIEFLTEKGCALR